MTKPITLREHCARISRIKTPKRAAASAANGKKGGRPKGMYWVSVKDALPNDRQAVLVRYKQDNWLSGHTLANGESRANWRWKAALFMRGRTDEECKAINLYRQQDVGGNNMVPYCWKEFGPGCLFGQDVTHWAAISDPCEDITKTAPQGQE